jgi:uncharacterized LabA/DUF88 family protein
MRVAFVVDGFNVYHSLREAARASPNRSMKWLDLQALCASYTATVFGPWAVLAGVYYFSALAKHLEADNPDVVKRHQSYIDALRVSGVEVTLSNFKGKDNYIPFERCTFRIWPFRRFVRLPLSGCTIHFRKHEEKETDVAIATKMFELLHTGVCDTVVIVSGDTDLSPRSAPRENSSPPNMWAWGSIQTIQRRAQECREPLVQDQAGSVRKASVSRSRNPSQRAGNPQAAGLVRRIIPRVTPNHAQAMNRPSPGQLSGEGLRGDERGWGPADACPTLPPPRPSRTRRRRARRGRVGRYGSQPARAEQGVEPRQIRGEHLVQRGELDVEAPRKLLEHGHRWTRGARLGALDDAQQRRDLVVQADRVVERVLVALQPRLV